MIAISLYTSNFGITTKKVSVCTFILPGPGTMYLPYPPLVGPVDW